MVKSQLGAGPPSEPFNHQNPNRQEWLVGICYLIYILMRRRLNLDDPHLLVTFLFF